MAIENYQKIKNGLQEYSISLNNNKISSNFFDLSIAQENTSNILNQSQFILFCGLNICTRSLNIVKIPNKLHLNSVTSIKKLYYFLRKLHILRLKSSINGHNLSNLHFVKLNIYICVQNIANCLVTYTHNFSFELDLFKLFFKDIISSTFTQLNSYKKINIGDTKFLKTIINVCASAFLMEFNNSNTKLKEISYFLQYIHLKYFLY
ncbi:uncharacterized protein ASCRUDRAFT_146380 [Ascoidea rubescens DSM 1968]|uniref:Uncharacterized protein n=1 Tax=Ascoidea rubescens DSM 1968 TaxID=1344418 RepID=A0A1D2VHP3_9ASCO|nr:hypothetical protein ASCRUDRAFT_146380 [Ascoidea rubescens DSM 1968]ODV61122.1 hypothetical protein ASCRUDRAFT_146380 [Ascoidea rubescens DSM 1968]